MKIFCELCGMVDMEPVECGTDDLNDKKIWGDIVCPKCRLVIGTIEAEEEGTYEMKKVGDNVRRGRG